jgi:hypothetical protein
VYSVLSYLFVSPKISISVSILTLLLVFGLTRYYDSSHSESEDRKIKNCVDSAKENNNEQQIQIDKSDFKNENLQLSNVLFIFIFGILLIISSFTFEQKFHIFITWNEIGILELIQLGAAIMLCFFIPGYAIILVLSKKYRINPVSTVLLSYFLSLLITGLTAYIFALSFDNAISEIKYVFILIYLAIFGYFVIYFLHNQMTNPIPTKTRIKNNFDYHLRYRTIIKSLSTRANELLVLGSLFAFIIVSTYVMYGGITVGDQWYHQGRALLFISGSIREAVLSNGDVYYPPFQSALLAALTSVSGFPLVNAYASIAFLNAIPMFAFYYFFSTWVPARMHKATLLACSLFILSSGFGWVYIIGSISTTTQPILSEISSLDAIRDLGHLDIVRTSNFVIATAPDFSTGLIYMALPAGFVLLGLIRTLSQTKSTNILIVSAISVLGIISHYEFYFFIIIACILPILFKIKQRYYLYISFLIALLSVYLLNTTTPGDFYTSIDILGLPLIFLTGLFVIMSWTIYSTLGYLQNIFKQTLLLPKVLRNLLYHNNHRSHRSQPMRSKFMTITMITFIMAYLYLLTFIVLSQLSLDTTIDHTSQSNVPWYLYPMRLGIAGLLGMAYILSYLFKKFEKEIFVFGIIIIISVLIGPHYDAHRLSKYVMVGAVGFASLLIYKVLTWRAEYNSHTARNVVVISTVVTFSGLSILIFMGYISLILQTEDYVNTSSRRHFPSGSELRMYEKLYNNTDMGSNKYNVISFPEEYNIRKDGIMAKVQAFAGFPFDKLRQSPLTLNSSTLDALYSQLDYGDVQYILLPKASLQFGNSITEPVRFAIDYFKRFYENNDTVVLQVPPIRSPASFSEATVGIVYEKGQELPSLVASDKGLLLYDNKTFNFKIKDNSMSIEKDNQTQTHDIKIFGSKADNGNTVWSKMLKEGTRVNSLESTFRTYAVDGNNESGNIGLKWREGDMEYYTKLSDSGLELYEKAMKDKDKQSKTLAKNTEIENNDGVWNTLKIETLDDSIHVYMNNLLAIKASKSPASTKNEGILKVGLINYNNDAEFKPIKIWTLPSPGQDLYYNKTKYYNHYYPLSLLALSNNSYELFRDDDLSVFAKQAILVPDSIKFDDDTINRYLEYVSRGGTLIIINSDNNFNGTFSRLFSIQSNDTSARPFSSIGAENQGSGSITLPGLVKRLDIKTSPDVKAISSYRNNINEAIAPFLIEKALSNGGKLLLINAQGYFNTISNSPRQYFHTLSNISNLLGLDSSSVMISKNTAIPMKGFIGKAEVSGGVTLNSSSISFLADGGNSSILRATNVKIYNKTNSPVTFNNLSIKGIKVIGDYEVTINSMGNLELPESGSNHNYITVTIPNGFNMTLSLHPTNQSHLEILSGNHTFTYPIKVYNNSEIHFYDIRHEEPLESVTMSLKSPVLTFHGHVDIKNANFDGYLTPRGALYKGPAFNLQGNLTSKFDFVDNYNEGYYDGTKTQYITYLQSLVYDGNTEQHQDIIKLPGEISNAAKQPVPLVEILTSFTNIMALIILSLATIVSLIIVRKAFPARIH